MKRRLRPPAEVSHIAARLSRIRRRPVEFDLGYDQVRREVSGLISRAGRSGYYEGLEDRVHRHVDSFRARLASRIRARRDQDIAELREARRALEPVEAAYRVRAEHDRDVLARARTVRDDVLRDLVDLDVPKPNPFATGRP